MKLFWRALNVATAIFVVATFVSCSSKPVDEMILADVAVKAAQKAKADAIAVDAYRKAENFYLRAKRDYAEGYFDSARKHAIEARLFAEKAEFRALQKQGQAKAKPEAAEPEADPNAAK